MKFVVRQTLAARHYLKDMMGPTRIAFQELGLQVGIAALLGGTLCLTLGTRKGSKNG